MDKAQALHEFWSGFGLPAYASETVPDNATLPYITYDVSTDSLDYVINLNASLWYRSMKWEEISKKAEEIAQYISTMQPPTLELDNGRVYISKGSPFAQRMNDEGGADIRRIVLSVNVEFLTKY